MTMRTAVRLWWLGVFVVCLLTPALAQQPPVDGFVPVAPGELQTEQIPAARLVISAYAVVWAVLAFYVWTVWRRLTKIESELRDVSGRLGARR
jgi:CcmD family protein